MTAPAPARLHAAAVLATLTAAGLTAFDGVAAVHPSFPYVVAHFSPAMYGGAIGDRFGEVWIDFQTTSVGITSEQALWMHDSVVGALLGAAPAVTGRTPHAIWLDQQPQPVQRDDTLESPLFYATAQWRWHTSP